jgi:streptogramin lyase
VEPINDRTNPYDTFRDFGVLPNGRSWGSVSAINVDIDGIHIWAGDRCGANSCAESDVDPIVKLDPDGNVVEAFGAGLITWPHGMDVDRQGNVWVADALTIGVPGESGAPPERLSEPNDVLIAPDGSVFIGETHSSQYTDDAESPTAVSRIHKYAADGTYLMSFGEWGYADGQFRSPHSLAMDSRGRLFVADRGNRRIQIFDQDGNHLDTCSESDPNYNPGGWQKGLRVGSAVTGEVWYFVPAHESERPSGMGGVGSMGEGVTVDMNGIVYAGEVGPVQGVTKFVPRERR